MVKRNTSSEELPEGFFYLPHRYQFDFDFLPVQTLQIMFGDEHALEAQFFRFADALLDAVHRTDFTAQAHFARHAHAGFYFRVHIARKDGADDRQVDGRVVHFQSSGYVEEHVLLRQLCSPVPALR